MAKYKIIEPSEDKFTELARISYNLRFYSKIWKDHYGAHNRVRMLVWEENMDAWLKENLELLPESESDPEINKKVDRWGNGKMYTAK